MLYTLTNCKAARTIFDLAFAFVTSALFTFFLFYIDEGWYSIESIFEEPSALYMYITMFTIGQSVMLLALKLGSDITTVWKRWLLCFTAGIPLGFLCVFGSIALIAAIF